jgi:hypothetical protein
MREGVIYTSIYVDSRITKWDYINLKVLNYVPSHYNIGHLVSSHGDVLDPRGDYLIALNKLSIDRFNPVGPLHPQNHQLIDIKGGPNDEMKIIYDLPIPMGEPHYTIMMDVDNFSSILKYDIGTDITTNKKSPYYTALGSEMYRWRPGETATLDFVAEKAGMYPLLLDDFHHPGNRKLQGYLAVKFNSKAENNRLLAYAGRVQKDMEMQAFKPSAIEMKNMLPGEMEYTEMQAFKPSAIEMKNMLPGEMEYLNHGCNACHRFGEEYNGPDLLMVDKRRTDEWLKSWITETEKHMGEADIEAMRQKYKLAMPNQNVSDEAADKIIEYLKAKSEQVMKEMSK